MVSEGRMGFIGAAAQRVLLFFPFIIPIIFLVKVPVVQREYLWWFIQILLYTYILPILLDVIGGRTANNIAAERRSDLNGAEYKWLVRFLAIKVLILKVLAFKIISVGRYDDIDSMIIAFFVGQSIGSYGIFIAHELMHRSSRWDRMLGDLVLITTLYPHFSIHHVYGHHRHVGTSLDSATSRYGETIYAFLPRSIIGGFTQSWSIEAARLKKSGRNPLSIHNRMLRYFVGTAAFVLALYGFWGAMAVVGLVIHAVVAVCTLETINYIQHYGLERRETSPGQFERYDVAHAWSAETRFTNAYWLGLGRHSDHHHMASRRFETLRYRSGELELPAGLPAMFLLAWLPPVWFKVMNPRIEALRRQEGEPADNCVKPDPDQEETRGRDYQGFLLAAAIVMLFSVDLVFGYPTGFGAVAVLSLLVITGRRIARLYRRKAPGQSKLEVSRAS